MRKKHPEDDLQRFVVDLLRAKAFPDVIWFHPPNGGGRSKAEAGIFKALGVLAGVADIVIIYAKAPGAFLELKSSKGSLNASQKAFKARCEGLGLRYAVARSPEEASAILWSWGVIESNPLAHDARAA